MNKWKRVSIMMMSLLLVAIMAACGGGASSGTTATSGQGSQATASTPTADTSIPTPVPTSAPSTGGGCTTAASCQKAVVVVSPHQVQPGGKVTVTVKGWLANTKLKVFAGTQVEDSDQVSATSDAQGNFSVILTIRANIFTDASVTSEPSNIHISVDSQTDDGSNNLNVSDQLTIMK